MARWFKNSILSLFVVLAATTQLMAASVELKWDANTESDLAGYKVYYGTTPGSYGSPINLGKQTTYTVNNLNNGTYYFAVTAVDNSGNESGYSNQVVTTIQAGTYTVSATPTSVAPGSTINASWTASNGASSLDWVALYRSGDANSTFQWWSYVAPATSGSFSITAPAQVGDYELRYLVNDSYTQVAKSAVITVRAACTYSVAPAALIVASSGATGSIAVSAGNGCSWSAAANASWVTITSGTNGSGNGSVSYSVAANKNAKARTAILTIAGQTVSLRQWGTDCDYLLTPSSQFLPRDVTSGKVQVARPNGCSWSASPMSSWITMGEFASSNNQDEIKYSVSPNQDDKPRLGKIRVGDQIFTVAQAGKTTAYFAQYTTGGPWNSTLVLTNPSTNDSVSGFVSFLNDAGQMIDVSVNGAAVDSVRSFTLAPLGSASFKAERKGEVVTGSVLVSTDAPVTGVVKFATAGLGMTGVGASDSYRAFMAPVERDAVRGSNTGLAVSNTEGNDLELELTLRQLDGREVAGGFAVRRLAAHGHMAQFIDELFPGVQTAEFSGTVTVRVRSDAGEVAATALQIGSAAGEFAAVPVVGMDPAPVAKELYFAQFANGSNWTSSLYLSNPQGEAANGELSFFDAQGNPVAVSVKGHAQAANVMSDLRASGGAILPTDGQGQLVSGSARVTASQPIGGVLRYARSGVGMTGIAASEPMAGFIAPVQRSQAQEIQSGVSIASTGAAVRLYLQLRNQDGTVVAGGEATLDLAANGHTAKFIEQLFPNADTREFTGTVSVMAEEGLVVGTAIQIGAQAGQIATFPVGAIR